MEKMTSSTTSLENESTLKWKHDVFLNFLGNNPPLGLGENFTDHISTTLEKVGIRVFKDDDTRKRGTEISWEMNVKAIEESRICVILFTNDYAESKWCLNVVEKIMKCKEESEKIVIPAFADMDHSILRKIKGQFWKIFRRTLGDLDIDNKWWDHPWRHALKKVASLPSVEWRTSFYSVGRSDTNFMQGICDAFEANMLKEIRKEPLLVSQIHQVVINSRVEYVRSLLNSGTEEVAVVGIYGKEGAGKTILAKSVYNHLLQSYEYFCFLSTDKNIYDEQDPNGLVSLHGILPYGVSNIKHPYLQQDHGEKQERNRFRKALVIFDNIYSDEHIEALARVRMQIGPGSRIIATARDVNFLHILEAYKVYEMKELNMIEGLKLFNLNAFGNTESAKGFEYLSFSFVQRARGTPSVIEGLGSYLSGKSFLECNAHLKSLLISDNATLEVPSKSNTLDKYDTERKQKSFSQVGEIGGSVDASENIFPQANSNSQKSYMMRARELVIGDSDHPQKWRWIHLNESSSIEVAELLSAKSLEIRGTIETRKLSPWTNYGAFLIFKCGDTTSVLQSAMATVRVMEKSNDVPYDETTAISIDLNTTEIQNEDGWKEIKLGQFINYKENEDMVEVRLLQRLEIDECGLIIQGIEFRPKGFEVPYKEFNGKTNVDKASENRADSRPSSDVARLFLPTFGDSSPTYIEEDGSSPSSPTSVCELCEKETLEVNATRCGLFLDLCKKMP